MLTDSILAALRRRIPPRRVCEILVTMPADSRQRLAAAFAERPVKRKIKLRNK